MKSDKKNNPTSVSFVMAQIISTIDDYMPILENLDFKLYDRMYTAIEQSVIHHIEPPTAKSYERLEAEKLIRLQLTSIHHSDFTFGSH